MSNDQLSSKNCEKLDYHRGSPERIEKLKDDLNISPISFASTQMSHESSPQPFVIISCFLYLWRDIFFLGESRLMPHK
jgi:hypothetical protein